MRRPEPLAPPPPRPLLRDERAFIRSCVQAGDPPRLVAAYTSRPEAEVRQVVRARQ